ncbi:MAG: 1-acyl-sn-glycerol-3-phosphate acyltransferase [Haliea sp.]|nr:1-acyl-sn-glycerol-3-phosphate acyltransferase [Haliea sp.]
MCDQADVEKMRQLVREYPSMLLWTHKTYLDGMVVPKLLYDNDFPMPHMFGGANLNFPGLGFLLHRAGAIFIRRSFQDNELYKLTLRHYVGYLMENASDELGLRRHAFAPGQTDAAALRAAQIRAGSLPRHRRQEYPHHPHFHQLRPDPRCRGVRDRADQPGQRRRIVALADRLYPQPSAADGQDLRGYRRARGAGARAGPGRQTGAVQDRVRGRRGSEPRHCHHVPLTGDDEPAGRCAQGAFTTMKCSPTCALLRWAQERNLRISKDFDPAYADQLPDLIGIMLDEASSRAMTKGRKPCTASVWTSMVASYYRNTVIHFFVNKAIIELAMLKASENEGPMRWRCSGPRWTSCAICSSSSFSTRPPKSFTARYARSWIATTRTGPPC